MSHQRRYTDRRHDNSGVRPMPARESVYHSARCYGKLAYATRAKARRAKRNKRREYGRQYREYRCPY